MKTCNIGYVGDLEFALNIDFPDDLDANTVSGLCMFRLGRIPETGDVVEEQGFRFTIQSMDDLRVNLARIERILPDSNE